MRKNCLPIAIFLFSTSACSKNLPIGNSAAPPIAALCDVLNDPARYEGETITVAASYRYGLEWQEIFCLRCRELGRIWLEFDERRSEALNQAFSRSPKDQGTVNAMFTGVFRSTGGPFGDGGYKFLFRLTDVDSLATVSAMGWDPRHLPARQRRRLCGGSLDPP